jgi:gamma-butyrobetaine dioxygenase
MRLFKLVRTVQDVLMTSCGAIKQVAAVDGRLLVVTETGRHVLHPLWLRSRSQEIGDVDPSNRQRLFEPTDIAERLVIESAELRVATATDDLDVEVANELIVRFDDAHTTRHSVESILIGVGELPDPDALPSPRPWTESPSAMPTLDWSQIGEPAAVLEALTEFHRSGWFLLTGTPTTPASLLDIAGTFGRVSATNFGVLFDVETNPDATDLAYTPAGLSAHLDQPYRRPTPGLQFLHTLVNDAVGGESTVVDGLAAVTALRAHDPSGFQLLSRLPVEFRYDIGTDVVVERAPIIDLDVDGHLRQIRFSPRLDFAPAVDPDVLDQFYAARRWLAEWLNNPTHQLEFKMNAGDVLVVDNHRVLHGRTSFDPSTGRRHLQGCYIDHDGPATMWRLMRRRSAASSIEMEITT